MSSDVENKVVAIQGISISNSSPLDGQVLKYVGTATQYQPQFVPGPNSNIPSGTTIVNPIVLGESTFQPVSISPIRYASVNSQIFTTQIVSGTYTGVVATIPLPGTTGAPVGTGLMSLDCETSMLSGTGAASYKHSWRWNVAGGAVGALGPLFTSLAVGTNAGLSPSGWAATVQLDSGNQNAQVVVIGTGTIDCVTAAQWSYIL